MARVVVTTQEITRAGLNPALTAPIIDGDAIDPDAVFLWVDNASGGSINVTVQTTAAQDGLAVQDLVVAVPAGAARLIGPFPKRTFGQPAGAVESGGDDENRVYVDYSAVTSITRGVFSL